MINYLDMIYFFVISSVANAVFSVIVGFVMDIGTKEKPTYYRAENHDTYVVYKWFSGRAKGYKTFDKKTKITLIEFLRGKLKFRI